MRYAFIRQERGNFPIRPLCRAMRVSVSGFYDWLKRPPSDRAVEQLQVVTALRAAHKRGWGFYGPKKLQDELRDEGLDMGINRIRRLRRKYGIYCLQKKRFRATTQSTHRYPVAPNLLGQCFATTRPCEVWVADITYVDTAEGWLYVAGVKDLFTKELVGCPISTRLTASLAIDALDRAFERKQPAGGLIHHSDRGSPIRLRRLPASAAPVRHAREHEPQGKLLRQCADGELLRHVQDRARLPATFRDARGGAASDLRVHRSVLQPPATPRLHRQLGARGVRATLPCIPDGGVNHRLFGSTILGTVQTTILGKTRNHLQGRSQFTSSCGSPSLVSPLTRVFGNHL